MTTDGEPGGEVVAEPGGEAAGRTGATATTTGSMADRRPRQRRDPLWAKLVITFGVLVMLASGLTAVVPRLVANWALSEVERIDAIPPEFRGTDISGAVNLLLLGLDQSLANDNVPGTVRSDSIVLLHIPAAHDQAYMISLPRDLLVTIPSLPEVGLDHDLYPAKITAAFQTGATATDCQLANVLACRRDLSRAGIERGVAQTIRTMSNLVPGGLRIHAAALIDFSGFEKVVEAVGGVRMCIDEDTFPDGLWSIHHYADGTRLPTSVSQVAYESYGSAAEQASRSQRAHYEPGCHDLQPWQALDLSRQRVQHEQGDYGRHQMQQQLLTAIVEKVASTDPFTNFGTIRRLQQAAGPPLTLDLGGQAVEDWVFTLRNLRAGDILMVNTYAGQSQGGPIDGDWYEPVDSSLVDLLRHVQSDTVADFLDAHPDWRAAA